MTRSIHRNADLVRRVISIAGLLGLVACAEDGLRNASDLGEGSTVTSDCDSFGGPGALVEQTFSGVKFEFSCIPAGSFRMGVEVSIGDWDPIHQVTLTKPYLMLRNEVTQAQYEAVMGSNPSWFTGNPSLPVDSVSWADAVAFCEAMNEQAPAAAFRLPTEAEWEFAARAGRSEAQYGPIDEIAWLYQEELMHGGFRTFEVMTKRPNRWQLFDVIGNVNEWIADWHGDYRPEAQVDPRGPSRGDQRVIRHGWPYLTVGYDSVFSRSGEAPETKSPGIGFRPVRALP